MINYYHRFIPHAAEILAPLYQQTSKKQKNLDEWTLEHEEAFQKAKKALAKATTLIAPDSTEPLFLVTDASNTAIGAVLEQGNSNTRRSVGFFSRKLNSSERKYSTFDRELLAVHAAIRHFHHLLEGIEYTICTDHKPLIAALSKTSDAWTTDNRTTFQL